MKTFLILLAGTLSVSASQAQSIKNGKVDPNRYATIAIGVIAAEEATARDSDCDTALEALSHESQLSGIELMIRFSNSGITVNEVNKTAAEYVESIKQLKTAAKAACAE